jgi:hypothetical protein
MMVMSPLDALLVAGGDERIALDAHGLNRYGYGPAPHVAEASFGSSTASTISVGARQAAADVYARLSQALVHQSPADVYEAEMARVRARFLSLCGLGDYAGLDVIFAASGTDIHLYAAELAGSGRHAPLLSITVESSETGSGVATALQGRHFMSRTACGDYVTRGHELSLGNRSAQLAVTARDSDGRLRPEVEVEAEIDRHIGTAASQGQQVLLVVADVSKTGLISPGLASVLRLRDRWAGKLRVMIDACQFRVSPQTMRAYLDLGFPVAVTGSKFIGGPAFSGALLCPPVVAEEWRAGRLPEALGAYAAPAEWPEAWPARRLFKSTANFGLLLRWEAALYEMAAFQAVPQQKLHQVMTTFSDAVFAWFQASHRFELADHRPLDRSAIGISGNWDEIPTIFPFFPGSQKTGYLGTPETEKIYHQLAQGQGVAYPMRLGQPVACAQRVLGGQRGGQNVSALRLCFSARLAVEAAQSPESLQLVIARGLKLLDHTAALVAGYQPARRQKQAV